MTRDPLNRAAHTRCLLPSQQEQHHCSAAQTPIMYTPESDEQTVGLLVEVTIVGAGGGGQRQGRSPGQASAQGAGQAHQTARGPGALGSQASSSDTDLFRLAAYEALKLPCLGRRCKLVTTTKADRLLLQLLRLWALLRPVPQLWLLRAYRSSHLRLPDLHGLIVVLLARKNSQSLRHQLKGLVMTCVTSSQETTAFKISLGSRKRLL